MYADHTDWSSWNDLSSMSTEDLVHDDTPSPSNTNTELKQEELQRMPSELVAYRNRIDASTREQKRYIDVLSSLNKKVLGIREKNAESAARISLSQTLPAVSSSFYEQGALSIRTGSCDVLPFVTSEKELQPLMSSTAIGCELLPNDEIDRPLEYVLAQLDEEIEKNDKMQEQNYVLQTRVDTMSRANETMREEIQKMSDKVEKLKEESEAERNTLRQQNVEQRNALELQKQKIYTIWSAFNRIKGQVQNLRCETANDLNRQKTELLRCGTNMEIGLKQALLQMQSRNGSRKDENALDDVLKEYEELTTRYFQVLEEQNEKTRKITDLEATVRKVNEDRDAAHDSLKRILLMPELTDIRSRKSRSLSPSKHLTFDTIHCVRTALRDQEDEIRQLKWVRDEQTAQINELQEHLLKSEEERKAIRTEASDLQKQLELLKYEKDDVERDCSSVKEKVELLELERMQLLTNNERLQKQISTLNESHQATVENLLQKQSEECIRLRKQFEDEKEEIGRDFNFKLEKLKMDLEQVIEEKVTVADALRKYESDCSILRARLSDKENEISTNQVYIHGFKEEIQDLQQSLAKSKEAYAEIEQSLRLAANEASKNAHSLAEVEVEKRLLKDENGNLKSEVNLIKAELSDKISAMQKLQESYREVTEDATDLRRELTACKTKVSDIESERNIFETEMKNLRDERLRLEETLMEKNGELTSLSEQLQRAEKANSLNFQEMEFEREKIGNLETDVMRLNAENERLTQELRMATENLERKTATNQKAMDELVENYRSVEKERSNILIEKDAVLEELSVFREQLNNSEEKRLVLQRNLDAVEASKIDLQKKLCHFEDCAKKALRATNNVSKEVSSQQRTRETADQGGQALLDLGVLSPGTFSHLRGSSSSHNLSSEHVTFDSSADQLNISSSVEITFSVLRNRIEELENDKKTLTEGISRLKSDYEFAAGEKKDLSRRVDTLQKQLSEVEEEHRSLETRLASSRQLLVSQEEDMRSKDQQQKSLKAKLLSADLHTRDKDAKISSLNDLIQSLRKEVNSLTEDRKAMKETFLLYELERSKADALQRQADDELLKYRSEITALHNKKEDLVSRLSETENQLAVSQRRCIELEHAVRDYRGSIRDLKKGEGQWKKKIDSLGRKEEEDFDKQQKLSHLQMELEEAVLKNKGLLKEREQLKGDLRDAKAQQVQCAQKITELQQTVYTLKFENTQLQQRLAAFEKSQKDGCSLGSFLQEELETLRAEKVSSAAEKQSLRRRVEKVESERRELEAQRVRLERERAALKQHIETLELEKQKTDAAAKQTSIERLALDKSLLAMEKENRELYKNCSQLQKHVSQLEKDNGNHLLNENASRLRSIELQLQRVRSEKQELEYRLSNYDHMHSQAVRFLESKVALLTKQLEAEKKRRHDSVTRTDDERNTKDRKIPANESCLSQQSATEHSKKATKDSPSRQHRNSLNSPEKK